MNKSDTIRLNMLGLPVIQSMEDFSEATHVSKFTLYQLSKNSHKYYKTYEILKKSGKPRLICQPSKKLKGLQSWILVNILNRLNVSSSCKGFEKGTSIYSNAESHKGSNSILTIDLKDFFPTVTQQQVFNVFKSIGYNNLVSVIFSNICTNNKCLPQGSPCSPKLANLCAWQLDVRIQGYVGKRGINYTRYADDLSFSGLTKQKVIQIIPMIKRIINEEKFEINPSKTRIAGPNRAKIVTGLVISNDSIGIGREKYKLIRSKIHRLVFLKTEENIKAVYEINGWFAFIKSVDPKRFNKLKKYVKDLILKHPESLLSQLAIIKQ